MARHKKKPLKAATFIVAVVGAVCVLRMLYVLLLGNKTVIPFLLIYAGLIFIILIVIPNWRRNGVRAHVDAITYKHIEALVRQRTIQVRNDPYGKPTLVKWHSEVDYFITNHVRPALRPRQRLLMDKERTAISRRISQRVADAAKNRPAATVLPASITPAEFEAFCGATLSAHGWNVQLTPLGRDQGVDVIAEKNDVRVVLQCKLYSNPVGNKAVQEVAAGRVHQHAKYGAVVTNSTFTPSAKDLAASNGIQLLHHTDLPRLEQIVSCASMQLGIDWDAALR